MPDPGALLSRQEFLGVLRDCLDGVPPRQAEAFALRIVDEKPTTDVCKILDITATNLGVLIHRARMRLRRCLEVKWFQTEEAED